MKLKNAPEINAGSMADIAFLLLVFFLVTTTMDSEFGMFRKLPSLENIAKVKDRNVLDVWVNSDNIIMMEGEPIPLSEVCSFTKKFIQNPTNDIRLPEKKVLKIELLGDMPVSKQVISLKNDKNTSFGMYLKVQNELSRAYNQLRDELAEDKFGKGMEALKEGNQLVAYNAIRSVYPQRISEAEPFENY